MNAKQLFMSKDKSYNDFKQMSSDPQKFKDHSTGHWFKINDGGSVTVQTGRHNTYGAGMSKDALNDRLNK